MLRRPALQGHDSVQRQGIGEDNNQPACFRMHPQLSQLQCQYDSSAVLHLHDLHAGAAVLAARVDTCAMVWRGQDDLSQLRC